MKGTGYGLGESEYTTVMNKVEPVQGKSGKTDGPAQLAKISGSFEATGKIICPRGTYELKLTGKVKNGSVFVTSKNFDPDQIKIAKNGSFKKNIGLSKSGKSDIVIKGRVRQGEIDIGKYFF